MDVKRLTVENNCRSTAGDSRILENLRVCLSIFTKR